jgi:hypothetical protein
MEPVKDQVIRVRHRPADFVLTNVTDVALAVDGQERSVDSFDEVARELAELRQGDAALNLANGSERMAAPVISSYRLSFRIATGGALQLVERAFVATMVDRDLSMPLVNIFLADPRCSVSGLWTARAGQGFGKPPRGGDPVVFGALNEAMMVDPSAVGWIIMQRPCRVRGSDGRRPRPMA